MTLALFARAQRLAAPLPSLLVEAERVAHSTMQGVHGRRRAGIGENFWQFRNYDAGEPAERIDWRQSARSDRLYVRLREWEAVQSVALWADGSGSMHYASRKDLPTKSDNARLLVLALASLLQRGGERVLWSEGDNFVALRSRAGLERAASAITEKFPMPPRGVHAHAILASDFLMPEDDLHRRLRLYAAQRTQGCLVHIVDPLEESFALDGRVELLGAEGEAAFLVPNATALRDAYRQKFTAHRESLQRMADSMGWLYLCHLTSQPPRDTLQRLYLRLAGH